MTQHDVQLWDRMIQATDDYLAGHLDLATLIAMLEGSLTASEIEDRDIRERFYDLWGWLETAHAACLELAAPISDSDMVNAVKRMRNFLLQYRDRIART